MIRESWILGATLGCAIAVVGCGDENSGTTTTTGGPAGSATAAASGSAAPSGDASAAASAAPAATGSAAAGSAEPIAPPAHTVGDIVGDFKISGGTQPDGASYEGKVAISKVGETFALKWEMPNKPTMQGVAIPAGSMLGVGYSQGGTYGVTVYAIKGGELSGHWTSAAAKGKFGMENLKGPESLDGEFKIEKAQDPDGGTYAGTVTIKPNGDAHLVEWKLESESYSGAKEYKGTGIKEGDFLVVGWGDGAGSGVYTVEGEKLTGKWAGPGDSKLGSESLGKEALEPSEEDLMKEMMGE